MIATLFFRPEFCRRTRLGAGTVRCGLIALCVACVPVIAPAEEPPPEAPPATQPSAVEAAAPALSPEARTERLDQLRTQLIAVRREFFLRRQQIEAGEDARVLVREIDELRQKLREKSQQLETLVAADEQWHALREQETALLEELRELSRPAGDAETQDILEEEP